MAEVECDVTKQENIPTEDTKSRQAMTNKEANVDKNKNILPQIDKSSNIFIFLCIIGVILGISLEILNVQNSSNITKETRPKYWVLTSPNKKDNLLKHLHLVLGRIGYERTTNETPWDLLWAHPYPFSILKPHLNSLKSHQKVNHFPGIGFIANKVDLATTESKYIPKAFRLPKDKDNFEKYALENQKAVFVEKHNQHRGVVLKNVTEMSAGGDKFVQEYVPNPFLVDGYKFDIGVYVVVTSVDPLRVYYYNGDVLFRYCPEKYHPFDPSNLKKYVVADDYRPVWKVPALASYHTEFGYGMKDAFDIYVRSKGKDPAKMWEEVQKAVREIFVKKEKNIIESLKNYASKHNFFEFLRVDLMLDEDMNVYLLEVNMSPNLSSPKPTNQLLYEQVLYNVMSLVGVGRPQRDYIPDDILQDCGTTTNKDHDSCLEKKAASAMISAYKNIVVWGEECSSCEGRCNGVCALCLPCLTANTRRELLQAHREHLHRGDFRRLYPSPMMPNAPTEDFNQLSPNNKLMHLWYQGKCNVDASWCS